MAIKKKYCKGCKTERPLAEFGMQPNSTKLRITCLECEATEQRRKRKENKLYHGYQRLVWAYLYRCQMAVQAPGAVLPIETLVGIMKVQRYCDPLTGRLFPLPTHPGQFSGWVKWVNSLDKEERIWVPHLTPVNKANDYTVGNVVFLPRILSNAVVAYGCLANMRELLRNPTDTICAPQVDLVNRLSAEWLASVRQTAMEDAITQSATAQAATGEPAPKKRRRAKRRNQPFPTGGA